MADTEFKPIDPVLAAAVVAVLRACQPGESLTVTDRVCALAWGAADPPPHTMDHTRPGYTTLTRIPDPKPARQSWWRRLVYGTVK